MCDRSTEGGEPQLQECAEYLGDASLRLLRAMIHSRDLVGWGILASDDVRSARDRFSGCSRQIDPLRSEEHTSELQSLMRTSYAVFCLKKKTKQKQRTNTNTKHKKTTKEQ